MADMLNRLNSSRFAPYYHYPWQSDKLDTTNFDVEFTSMTPKDSMIADTPLSQTAQTQFQGFTYIDGTELSK